MEDDSTNDLIEASANKMDKICAGVMPDSWIGHARIVIAGHDLSEGQKRDVLRHTRNLVEDKGYPAEETAEKVIEKLGY